MKTNHNAGSREGSARGLGLWLGALMLVFCCVFPPAATADPLAVEPQDFACREGRFFVSLSLRNDYTYNRRLLIALKISKGEEVAACEMKEITLPGNSDETKEMTLDQTCEGEDFYLEYRAFDLRARARANNWLSDCPGS